MNSTKLGIKNASTFYSKKVQTDLFNKIETGKITAEKFLTELQKETQMLLLNQVNGCLECHVIGFTKHRIELIKALKNSIKFTY